MLDANNKETPEQAPENRDESDARRRAADGDEATARACMRYAARSHRMKADCVMQSATSTAGTEDLPDASAMDDSCTDMACEHIKERTQGLFSSCHVPQAALNSSWCRNRVTKHTLMALKAGAAEAWTWFGRASVYARQVTSMEKSSRTSPQR